MKKQRLGIYTTVRLSQQYLNIRKYPNPKEKTLSLKCEYPLQIIASECEYER